MVGASRCRPGAKGAPAHGMRSSEKAVPMRERFRHAAALAAAAVVAAGGAAAQGPPSLVGVDEVRHEPLAQTQPVLGRFVARQGGEVAARIAGPVTEMHIDVGDRVAEGDVLAVLDLDRLRLQRDLAAANEREMAAQVESARAQLAKRRQALERLEAIRESAAFNQARYDDAVQDAVAGESAVAAAAAGLARVRASLRIAEDELADGQVTAPYGGVVTARHTEIGAYVSIGDPVATLLNENDLEIEADVPYNRILGLLPGTVVAIALADGAPHHAVVRAVGAEQNAMTQTRRVRFTPRIDGAGVAIAAGESASVNLPLGVPREVVSVHKDAILKRQGLSLVYVVNAESAAEIRPVELGEAVGPRFEVLDGVAAGERVVVRGNERLRPGQAVRVGDPETAQGTGANTEGDG